MQPISHPTTLPPLAGLTGGSVSADNPAYHALQRRLPDLVSGRLQALLLLGESGSGKSRWVTGLARLLEPHGWVPLALSATPFQPLSSGRILAAFAALLAAHHLREEAEILRNPFIPVEDRLGIVPAVMQRKLACVLVLDGLEASLDPDLGHFLEPAMERLVVDLLGQSSGLSRVLISSLRMPVWAGGVPRFPAFRQEWLSPLQGGGEAEHRAAAVAGLDANRLATVAAMAIFHYPMPLAGYCAVTQHLPAFLEFLLQSLAEAGLAHRQDRPGAEPVWSLDPLLRGVGGSGEMDGYHARAAEYLFDLATRHSQDALALGWLELSLEAVGHALRCGVDRRPDAFVRALQYAAPVSDLFSRYGFLWEQERLNRQLLAVREHPRPLYLTAMAMLRREAGEEARPLLERVLTFGETLFPRECALALFDLASLVMAHQPEEAREKLFQALAINQRVGDRSGQAVCHAHLGFWGLQQAEMALARTHLEAALALCRTLNDLNGVANLLPWMGELLWRVGNLVDARRHFQEALHLLPPGGHAEAEAQLYHRLAIMDLGEERFDHALTGFLRSLEIKRATEDQRGESVTFFQLGRLARAMGNELASLRFLGLCQRIAQAMGDPDAGQTLTLYYELAATALGMRRHAAQAILDEVWGGYCKDRGQSLIAQTFTLR